MDYIVFDLEWNQSNTGEEEESKLLPFEIVEIGAIKLNSDKVMVNEFECLVKPEIYHEMHRITHKLIHLEMEELNRGIPFRQAAQEFLEWCGEEYIFCSWGPLDLYELQRNMKYYGMEPLSDMPIAFYDVQKLFSIAFEDAKSRRSLEYAVDFLNIEKDIPFHRAFSDAYYTAKVFSAIKRAEVFSNISYDTFIVPQKKEKEIFAVFDNYAKYITREFEDKTAIAEDKEIMSSKCYLCHKNLKRKIKWFTPNGKHYYCIAYCEIHGFMKFKLRIRKSENGKLYVIKTMKYISKEEAEAVRQRKEQTREHRRTKRLAKNQKSMS